jgi:ABC-type glycerol-3-phosphate transport system substrate-binding protein
VSDHLEFALRHGAKFVDDLAEPTRPVFGDPLLTEALQWYVDLSLVHGVMMPIEKRDAVDEESRFPADAFSLKKAAMVIASVGVRGGDIIPWSFDWGAVPIPRDKVGVSWPSARGYYIAARTAYPKEAWALVRSLSEFEHPVTGLIPARRSIAESAAYRQEVGLELADAAVSTLKNGVILATFGQEFNKWGNDFSNQLFWVINGDDTVEEMMRKLQERYKDRSFRTP